MSQDNSLFGPLFAIVWVILVLVVGLVLVGAVLNARKARQHGFNPLTMQTDLAAKVMKSNLLGANRSKAERLAELDSLLAAGTITPAEHSEARAAILRQ